MVSGQDQPFKGATKIVIDSITFLEAANKVLDAGMIIDKSDSTLGTIVSEYQESGIVQCRLHLRVKDNKMTVTGQYLSNVDTDTPSQISNRGMRGSPAKVSFNWLQDFALSFKKTVYYCK